MNGKGNRSHDREGGAILKKSQQLAPDQLFLSSDLKSQPKTKKHSIKLQPIQKCNLYGNALANGDA